MKKNSKNKEINEGLRFIAKSSAFILFTVFMSKVLSYIYRIIIARYLGPEAYGLFSLALMILGWFLAFSSFGLAEGLLRFISIYRGKKQPAKIKYLVRFSLIFLVFSTILSGAAMFFLADYISLTFFNNPDLIIFLKWFSILVPVSIFASIFASILKSYEKIYWYSFINNVLQNGVKLIVLVILLLIGLKTNALIFSYILGILSMLIVSYFLCKYKISEVFGNYNLTLDKKNEIKKELLSYSWPLIFSGIIMSIFYWIDTFTIGYFLSRSLSPQEGARYVGFYNAAIPITGLLSISTDLFLQLFFPLITKEFGKRNFDKIKELSKQVGKWIFLINLPIFLILFIFPGAVINILFGKEYLAAENVVRILSVSACFGAFVVISTNLLSMLGKSKLILTNLFIASLLNLILDIILVPRYGINGAAIATMIVWVSYAIVVLLQVKKFLSFVPFRRTMIKIFFVSLIPACLLLIIKKFLVINLFSMFLLVSFFFLSYILLIFLTKCLDNYDLMILKSVKHKLFNSNL